MHSCRIHYKYTYIHMHMDSGSSHPRILRGRVSEVVLTNQPQGASLASLARPLRLICQNNFARLPPEAARQAAGNRSAIDRQ